MGLNFFKKLIRDQLLYFSGSTITDGASTTLEITSYMVDSVASTATAE